MGRPATLKIDIVTDAKGASKGLSDASKGLDNVAKSAGKADDAVGRAARSQDDIAEASGTTASRASQVAGAFGDLGGAVSQLGGPFATFGGSLDKLAPTVMGLAGAGDILEATLKTVKGEALAGALAKGKDTAATIVHTVASKAAAAAAKVWAAGQWLLNAALNANPIALILIGLVALGAALYLAWTRSATFRNIVLAVWAAVKTAVGLAVGFLKLQLDVLMGAVRAVGAVFSWLWTNAVAPALHAIGGLVTGVVSGVRDGFAAVGRFLAGAGTAFHNLWNTAVDFIGRIVSTVVGLPGRIAGIAGQMLTAGANIARSFLKGLGELAAGAGKSIVGALGAAMNAIIVRPINRIIDTINTKLIDTANKIPFVHIPHIPYIPELAAGGIVTGPTLALIGERGPEAVIPLRAGAAGVGGVTNVTVTVNVPVTANPAEVGRQTVRALQAYVRANGPVRGITA